MQPVTIIRVQTPVCAVPGVLLLVRGHCAVRGVRDAHVSRPCTATPVLSCHDVLAVAADLFTPPCSEPRRAAPHRREKKKENRRAAHRAARRTHAPLCFAPFGRPFLFATRRGRLAAVASFSRTLIYTTNRACWACPAFSLARVLCLLLGQLLLR